MDLLAQSEATQDCPLGLWETVCFTVSWPDWSLTFGRCIGLIYSRFRNSILSWISLIIWSVSGFMFSWKVQQDMLMLVCRRTCQCSKN